MDIFGDDFLLSKRCCNINAERLNTSRSKLSKPARQTGNSGNVHANDHTAITIFNLTIAINPAVYYAFPTVPVPTTD